MPGFSAPWPACLMPPDRERPLEFVWTLLGIIAFVLFLVSLFQEAEGAELEILLGSHHVFEDDFRCNGERRDFNETNPGAILHYNGLLVGRYRNSQADCDGLDYSNLLGFEFDLGEAGPVQFTASGGIADGYEDDDDGWGEYRAFASVNGRWRFVKVRYGYKVVAFSLVFDIY